ncbi:MAG: FUSC family protein, partial [Xanthobacteraceae bacterium]|nr:FUSC family protein [Xanthobacteraceae bacterium]
PTPEIEREQRQIASDVTELAILATNLPFDTASRRPSSKVVRAFDESVVAILPLLAVIEDRIAMLRRSGLSQQTEQLIAAVADWCQRTYGGESAEAEQLKRDCVAAMPDTQLQASWIDLITVSLLGRLHELIDSWHDCLEVAALMRNPSSVRSRAVHATIADLGAKPLHVDHGIAALSALTAAFAISICCAFWIATAWPQGAVATGFVAVICSLFAALDDPTPTMSTLTAGIVASIPIAALYQFAILPAIDGYVALVVSLAPPLLLFGVLMAIPRYTAFGLAPILGFTVLLAFQPQYAADMASFLNSAIALVIGSLVGIATTRLIRVMSAQANVRRLLRSGWRDLADLADRTLVATRTEWASQMLDRVGLLAPRMSQAGNDPELACGDALRDLRTGVTIIELQETVSRLDGPGNKSLAAVLPGVAGHFRALARGRRQPPGPGLLASIDALIGDMLAVTSGELRHTGLTAAIGLRRNLYPDAPPYAAEAQKLEAKA